MDNNEAIEMLAAMGFARAQATEALRVSNGNVEAAANYLLSEPPSTTAATTNNASSSSSQAVHMIQASKSQYSFENGRSACTCMALTGAKLFLTASNPANSISEAFLNGVLDQGLAVYNQLVTSGSSVEHLSAEEVLATGSFPELKRSGEIRQGMLSRDSTNPIGLSQTLLGCQQSLDGWKCCIITKTPETVLVCLPPSADGPFLLIDTHPRPEQFFATVAYARIHGSLASLVESLSEIFPLTDLGPDIPELMAAMYNSFDVYLLVKA